MVSTGIPELSREENLDYLRAAFHSDLTVTLSLCHRHLTCYLLY
jgi:hypothetical protein